MKSSELAGKDGGFWYPLDNAAKIYPSIRTEELTSVFRVSVLLKERVRAQEFMLAIHDLEDRFPYYKVKLKAGFFWYYLEYAGGKIPIKPDLDTPCRAFLKKELMFRVLVANNRISVEFSHILTDATGAMEFLKSLLFTYLFRCGVALPKNIKYHAPGSTMNKEEYEDAYNKYFSRTISPAMNLGAAFHVPYSLSKPSSLRVSVLEIPADKIIEKSKSYGVTLTEYLTAIYLYVLQEIFGDLTALKRRTSSKLLRIEVPINLRQIYQTKTMRNFSLYVLPEIDLRLGHYSFDEVVKTVHHTMQLQTDKKLVQKILSRNVGAERNLIVKRIPLFIKSLIFSVFYAIGTSRYSGVVTNLGRVQFHPDIDQFVDHLVFVPPPPTKKLKVNCGVVGFRNKLLLCFGNITRSDDLEKRFLEFLDTEGIVSDLSLY